jgi:hypothetical protein
MLLLSRRNTIGMRSRGVCAAPKRDAVRVRLGDTCSHAASTRGPLAIHAVLSHWPSAQLFTPSRPRPRSPLAPSDRITHRSRRPCCLAAVRIPPEIRDITVATAAAWLQDNAAPILKGVAATPSIRRCACAWRAREDDEHVRSHSASSSEHVTSAEAPSYAMPQTPLCGRVRQERLLCPYVASAAQLLSNPIFRTELPPKNRRNDAIPSLSRDARFGNSRRLCCCLPDAGWQASKSQTRGAYRGGA